MALLFDDGSTQYLNSATTSITVAPFSVSAWFIDDAGQNNDRTIFQIQDVDAAEDLWTLQRANAPTNLLKFRFNSSSPSAGSQAQTSNTYITDVWSHAVMVEASSTDHQCYLDGDDASKGTSTTDTTPVNMDSMSIGMERDSSPADAWSGFIAEVAVWNVALTLADITILSLGYSPLFVKPGNLVNYWPLIGTNSPEIDIIGGFDMTLVNTPTKSAHPPIIYPAMPYIITAPAAAGLADPSPIGQLRQSGGMIGAQWQ